jgi:hypothetical protein
LPTDGWRVTSVYNATDGFPLELLHGRSEYRHMFPRPSENLGVPQFYRLRSNNLEVYPWAQANTTLEVDLFLPPAVLTGSDEPIWPEQYHRILVDGALELASVDDGNPKQAELYRDAKDRQVSHMMTDLLGPRGESYPEILDRG